MISRRRRDHRVCRTLFWMTLSIVAVQVGLTLLLDRRGPMLHIRFHDAQVRLERLRTVAHQPTVVFLGSSRMATLPADVVSDEMRHSSHSPLAVCNLAVPAGDLTTSDFLLENVFREKIHPQLVVVEVLPELLSRTNRWLMMHVLRQMTWRDSLANFGEVCRSGGLKRLVGVRTIPLYYFREPMLEQLTASVSPSPPPDSTSDVATSSDTPRARSSAPPADWSSESLSKGLPGYDAQWFRNYSIGGCSAEALERLLRRCQREGCPVLLVALPLPSPRRALYTFKIEAEFRAYMQETCERHHCSFIDLRDQLADNMFIDHHHIGHWGADVFGRLMARKVVAPVWQQGDVTVHAANRHH
jgi:hypothetical protein